MHENNGYQPETLGGSPPSLPFDETRVRVAVEQLLAACPTVIRHSRQVARLARELFDATLVIHGLSPRDALCLEFGALLHDIGWSEGRRAHHKRAQQRILQSMLPCAAREVAMIACIARYHRKALPQPHHPIYGEQSAYDQQVIRILAGCVRLADGFDYTHQDIVEHLACEITVTTIHIRVHVRASWDDELARANERLDLLHEALGRTITIQ